MSSSVQLHLLTSTSNPYGLRDDVTVLEKMWKKLAETLRITLARPKVLDIREPLSACDIQIHLEIPLYGAIPWAHVNLMWVNPEHWHTEYEGYLHAFDGFLFRDPEAAERFRVDWRQRGFVEAAESIVVLPWCSSWNGASSITHVTPRIMEFVCLVGGSLHKARYVAEVVKAWREGDPPLSVYVAQKEVAQVIRNAVPANAPIQVLARELSVENQQELLWRYRGHLVVSQAESFGYAAAHSETRGGYTLMNALPTFLYQYAGGPQEGVAWLSNTLRDEPLASPAESLHDKLLASPAESLRDELEAAFRKFQAFTFKDEEARCRRADDRVALALLSFQERMKAAIRQAAERRPKKGIRHLPPILEQKDCPPITVITPTFQRKRLMEIAYHNLLSTDYPHRQMEWIVVEDNDKSPHVMKESLASFQQKVPDLTIRYVTLDGRRTIGEKRNKGVEMATHDIVLFMDDDDHYPSTSFRRRVAWLTKGSVRGQRPRVACCTTLALYDLKRGVSAVNVPPYDLPLSQRVSEATLTFYKAFWNDRAFPEVSVAEGEAWLAGREQDVVEIPPQQIIVAFTHGANQSSRRLPPSDHPPSCFWNFPKEYLVFIHGLVGVDVA